VKFSLAAVAVTAGLAVVPATAPATAATGQTTSTTNGAITTVSDSQGWLATFTAGSRTVTLRGAQRTLTEPGVTPTVTGNKYVRLLPSAFDGTYDTEGSWLDQRVSDSSSDLLAIALQYVNQAPAQVDVNGVQFAGDASYGPIQADGTRAEGSDFNDYLGLAWTYGAATDQPETDQFHALDCSGFTRMVFGYRGGIPLELNPTGTALPRRASQMETSAPGYVVTANTGAQAAVSPNLAPGDLVFFDASTDDGSAIDHVGIYLGKDSVNKDRFISSRKTPDGPTLGDTGSYSVISGTGYYAKAYRSAKRL
jgi:cell wall-associated NlpC family hydrolase